MDDEKPAHQAAPVFCYTNVGGNRDQTAHVRLPFGDVVMVNIGSTLSGFGRHFCFTRSWRWKSGGLAAALWLAAAVASSWAGGRPELRAFDLEGHAVNPLGSTSARATVLLFVRPDCPISNRYAPEVRRLHGTFGPAGVAFWLVYADGTVSADAIRRHVREYDYPCAALRDPEHRLVEFCGAKVTPEAAVIAPDGRVVYRGRIDDRYVAFGKWRPAPTRRDLFEALSAALEGRSVVPGGPAVGCTISPAE